MSNNRISTVHIPNSTTFGKKRPNSFYSDDIPELHLKTLIELHFNFICPIASQSCKK